MRAREAAAELLGKNSLMVLEKADKSLVIGKAEAMGDFLDVQSRIAQKLACGGAYEPNAQFRDAAAVGFPQYARNVVARIAEVRCDIARAQRGRGIYAYPLVYLLCPLVIGLNSLRQSVKLAEYVH